MAYKKLNKEEIKQLQTQNCEAEDWGKVQISDPDSINNIHHVFFSGTVKIGALKDIVAINKEINKLSGLYHSSIHNCTIGNNVYIANVKQCANYTIEDQVIISNVNTLITEGETSFGNGTELEVLNEGGGRELKIFDQLTAQIAYLLVLYRDNTKLITALNKIIDKYTESRKSTIGLIGKNTKIIDTSIIHNVSIGPFTQICNALHLEEGTITSCKEDPAFIGEGVIAKKFIISTGAKVDGSAIISSCFIGQSTKIGHQYSAENSVFFANCEGFHGEACSIFAGPYTVTHHKSTLLIAGLFSFYNAGSGTNQSNHMYKLGPLHQGILERGSKTGSFSYLLWPCRVGAFSAVIGKHYANFDTSIFPFSYINEDKGKSVLTPAMNLFTVGTRRDSAKWPARDKRKTEEKMDQINFNLYSPYTINKMLQGYEILIDLYEKAPQKMEYVKHKGIQIKRLMLRTCAKYYQMGIKVYIGETLIHQLQSDEKISNIEDLKNYLKKTTTKDKSEWIDIAGLLCPKNKIEDLINIIKEEKTTNIQQIQQVLKEIKDSYDQYNWNWCVCLIEQQLNIKIKDITVEQINQIIADYKESAIKLNNMTLKDASKEFDSATKIGFGIDGDQETQEKDFTAVRGTYENNKFIKEMQQEIKNIEKSADNLIKKSDCIKQPVAVKV